MKSLILYGSPKKLTNSHRLVTSPNTTFRQPEYHVRADLVEGECLSALLEAKPLEGETVLNSVDVED